MLKKIKLKNFMSHKDSELELCAGVNVLTGPNNSGKSAIVTALQLLTELPTREGTYMIRHGEKEAEVTVETSEGDVITWGRKEASSYLIINGERHTRISNNQGHFLDELHKVLKLPQVKNKEESFDIHFASQKQPIFLLDDPPSRAATFFSVSSDAGRLVEVRDLFKSKINKAKERRNSLERKLIGLKTELEKLSPLIDLEGMISNLKIEFDMLIIGSEKVTAGFELFEIFKSTQNESNKLLAKNELLGKVISPPVIQELNLIDSTITDMKCLRIKQIKLEKSLIALQALKTPNELESIQTLQASIESLCKVTKAENVKSKVLDIILKLSQPPELIDCSVLEEHVKKHKLITDDMSALTLKLEKSTDALKKWIQDNPTCPTCGASLNEEHLLTHE